MFSNSKRTEVSQNIFMQELSEEQLAQVAGGTCSKASNDNDADDKKMMHKHHHKHHHKMTKPKMTTPTTWNHYNSDAPKVQYGTGHW